MSLLLLLARRLRGDSTPGGAANAYLTEGGFGFTLEDGSGVLLME